MRGKKEWQKENANYKSIIDLANEQPNVNVTVKVGELMQMADYVISKTREGLEKSVLDANSETYYTIEQTAKMLSVDKTTLWRWNKDGYLTHISIGGLRRYRKSDIQKLLGERSGNDGK